MSGDLVAAVGFGAEGLVGWAQNAAEDTQVVAQFGQVVGCPSWSDGDELLFLHRDGDGRSLRRWWPGAKSAQVVWDVPSDWGDTYLAVDRTRSAALIWSPTVHAGPSRTGVVWQHGAEHAFGHPLASTTAGIDGGQVFWVERDHLMAASVDALDCGPADTPFDRATVVCALDVDVVRELVLSERFVVLLADREGQSVLLRISRSDGTSRHLTWPIDTSVKDVRIGESDHVAVHVSSIIPPPAVWMVDLVSMEQFEWLPDGRQRRDEVVTEASATANGTRYISCRLRGRWQAPSLPTLVGVAGPGSLVRNIGANGVVMAYLKSGGVYVIVLDDARTATTSQSALSDVVDHFASIEMAAPIIWVRGPAVADTVDLIRRRQLIPTAALLDVTATSEAPADLAVIDGDIAVPFVVVDHESGEFGRELAALVGSWCHLITGPALSAWDQAGLLSQMFEVLEDSNLLPRLEIGHTDEG